MAKRRASQAPVGLTSNGVLLVNVLGLLDTREAGKVRACLPAQLGSDWFVGVAIRAEDTVRVLTRIDDAAAEAASAIAAKRYRASAKELPQTPRGKPRRAASKIGKRK